MTDRYQILDPLASGGRGDVFRGWDSSLGREVAIKRIRAHDATPDDLVREARILSSLQHPNIVTVYDVGVDPEGAYIVMELIKGETLDDLIVRGALTEKDFSSLAHQTLEGMIAAHAAGLIHLDLKPGNLMITWHASGTFQVKILDFGLAQAAQAAGQTTDDQDSVLGSVHFMAPEQFERAPVDTRTDIYALGAIFYYALTQQYPFQGETSPQVMVSHLYHRLTPLAQCRPDLPTSLCLWVERLMSRQPANRPESVSVALQQFKAAQRQEAVPVAIAADDGGASPGRKKLMSAGGAAVSGARGSGAGTGRVQTGTGPRPATGYMPPSRPPARRSGLPKWTYVTIPFLAIVIAGWAVVRYLERSGEADRRQRLIDLATEENPQGSEADVRLLLGFLEDPSTSPAAAQALSKLKGSDQIDGLIVSHLDQVKSTAGRGNLIKVIGLRGIQAAFPKIAPLVADPQPEIRKSAWTALGMITVPADLPLLIDSLDKVAPKEEDFAEQALVSAIEEAKDPAAAVKPVLAAYQGMEGDDPRRVLLLSVLGRVGGAETHRTLVAALADPSIAVRRAALSALAQSTTHELLPELAARLPQETDPANRLLLLTAATQMISQPGPLPQGELFEHAKGLFDAARDQREKDQALAAVSRVTDPAAVAFFDALAISEPNRKREAEAISKALQAMLAKVTPVAADAKLPAAKAEFQKAGAMSLMADILVNWMTESDWASWLVQIEEPGTYEVRVTQAHTSPHTGTYEIGMAGQTLVTKAVKTDGSSDFKTFAVGDVKIEKAGIYKLILRARSVPENEVLFRLRGLELKRK